VSDLRVIKIVPGNQAGITPGTYVRMMDLVDWLKARDLPKTAKAISDQVFQSDEWDKQAVIQTANPDD
jgi:hypothetical protein